MNPDLFKSNILNGKKSSLQCLAIGCNSQTPVVLHLLTNAVVCDFFFFPLLYEKDFWGNCSVDTVLSSYWSLLCGFFFFPQHLSPKCTVINGQAWCTLWRSFWYFCFLVSLDPCRFPAILLPDAIFLWGRRETAAQLWQRCSVGLLSDQFLNYFLCIVGVRNWNFQLLSFSF